MAIVWCRELPRPSGDSSGLFSSNSQRKWQLKIDSRTDNIMAQLQLLMTSGVLPYQFAPHPDNIFLSCRKVAYRVDNSGYVYTVTADYSSEPLNQDERQRAETPNPLDRSPRRWVEALEYDRHTDKDRDGNAIATSAGTKYPEPAYVPKSDFVIQVRQNVSAWPTWVETYNNKLNENELEIKPTAISTTRTYDPETVLFKYQGCSEPQEQNGVVYVEISYRLHVRESWQDSRLDEDLYYKDGSTLKPIKVDGENAVSPVPLDGSGGVLSNPTSDTAVFNDFDIIEAVDMTELSVLNT